MATTTTASVSAVIGERPTRRSFKLKQRGSIMAMTKKKKGKKKGNRGGRRG